MADVLLTHSYHLFYDPKQVRKMQPFLPLGTLYAAALLRQHGFSVSVFDTMLENPEDGFAAALRRQKPRVVVIYEDHFNFLSKMCLTRMRQVAHGMIDAARATGATVIVNGPDSSDRVDEYLQHGCDYVLLGEAEWTLLELLQSLLGSSGQERDQMPGVTFLRRSTGEVVRAASRPLLRDLDTLPFPARNLADVDAYRDTWKEAHGYFSMNLVASRGCPFRCNWCARPIYGTSFHVRSAESVAKEMKQLKELYGAEHLWFADDIFGLKQSWMLDLAQAVNANGASLPFKIQSRINLMSAEVTRALRASGCTEVWMGVESGSQKVLDLMEKGTRVEQVPTAVDNLRRAGMRACFFLQFGYPGETWEDIEETIALVRDLRPDDIGVSVSYPLPGTRFYDRVHEEMGEKTNWTDSDDLTLMFKGTYTTDFYRALRNALHAEVNAWALPPSGQNGGKSPAGRPHEGDEVAQLWELVRAMEKHCRNEAPTLSPCVPTEAASA